MQFAQLPKCLIAFRHTEFPQFLDLPPPGAWNGKCSYFVRFHHATPTPPAIMPRNIWKGAIAFGLVNIPVSLTSAESKPDIQFHMVDSKNHARIRYERVNADTGEEVPWDRLVKGYEHEDGQFILLSEEDLESVQPSLTKSIEITEFVSLEDIDPLLFDKPYYLEPEKRGRKAYALLREALRKTGKAGISRVVIRTREYLSAMFARDEALILMLLRFPQEIRETSKLELPSSSDSELKPNAKEMGLATKLIDEMTGKWNPDAYHDEYRGALMDFIEKKISGGETVDDVKQPEDDETDDAKGKVLDLADYLERSFKKGSLSRAASASKTKKAAKKAATKHVSKKAPAKKSRRSA
jgi:DNA end-binding protein Ku